jgi:hypothetical protein
MARFARWVSVAVGVLALVGGATPAGRPVPVAAPAPTGTDLAKDADRAARRARPPALRLLTNAARVPRPAWSAAPGPGMVNRGYASGADADTGWPAATARLRRSAARAAGWNRRYPGDRRDLLAGRTVWPNG